MKSQFNEQCITPGQMNLIFNMRIFWRRLVIWSRLYISSRYLGIGTAEVSFERLYIENLDFGDALRIFFNRSIGNRFSELINQFSFGLRDLITDQLEEDYDGIRQDIDRLFQNANQTAEFLASINPYFDETEFKNLFTTYLQDTIQMANLLATQDYRMNIEYFDRLMNHADIIGDAFAQGLYEYIVSAANTTDALPSDEGQRCLTYEQMNMIFGIRMFWFDIVIWTRALMLSKYRNVGDYEEIYAHLQNIVDEHISNLKQFFDETPELNQLQLEIKTYIDLIDSLATAQIAGNAAEIDEIVRQMYQNAETAASLSATINPYLNEDALKATWLNNTQNTIDLSTTFLTEDYARNFYIFSSLIDQAEISSDSFWQSVLNYIFRDQPEVG
ncbi:MAG: hypothetical protein PHW03_04060 [Eubacteriales bacterium]|nr:hypothetical protein [Eubacteriales bacterium]MDD4389957.1 hypothetical protein [Eubacteriales bacterium]